MMTLTIHDLFASPDHYLHSFEGNDSLFMPMNRAAYHRSIFLDRRIEPAADRTMRVPVAALLPHMPAAQPTGWIFHVAHCGSTLLARALDHLSGNLVLREPLALRQLGLQPDKARLRLVTAMLGKRYAPELPNVIKANVPVNFILSDIIELDSNAHAIFLHSNLQDYLRAILRNDNHRKWVRNVTAQLTAYLGDLSALPDAERAAALWLAQMEAFSAALARMPNARTLEAERFFSQPRHYLRLSAAHLNVSVNDAALETIVTGPLFSTYSKNPDLPFDNQARLARLAESERALAPEIEQAERWIAMQGSAAEYATGAIATAALN